MMNNGERRPTYRELMAEIERLKKLPNQRRSSGRPDIRVSKKGCVSFEFSDPGNRKWPLSLYYAEWIELFRNISRIETFLTENKSKLSIKD